MTESINYACCPHCDPEHETPNRCSWGVRVAPDVDGDGQPTHLIVQPSNGAHVAQSDADWLFLLIRDRDRPPAPAVPRDELAGMLRPFVSSGSDEWEMADELLAYLDIRLRTEGSDT